MATSEIALALLRVLVIRGHIRGSTIDLPAPLRYKKIELRHPGDLEVQAWELAQQYNRPTAYDASYLALAESAGCELWTAGCRLVKAVAGALPWLKTVYAGE